MSRFTIIAAALVVNSADERFKTLEQLIAYAKSRPGELTCGSAGNGTSSHLACELLNQMAGIKVMHIPYKGGGAAMTDLLGGRISFMIDVMPNVSGQIAAGKLRALGVTTPERVASNPDIPTVSEAGVKGYEFYAWDGLYAPRARRPPCWTSSTPPSTRCCRSPRCARCWNRAAPFRRRPRGPA